MIDSLSSRHRIAYGCYLFMGLVGVAGLLDSARLIPVSNDTIIVGAMLASMLLAVVVPTALILSVILRKDRLLLLLAGLTIGVPLAVVCQKRIREKMY